MLRKKHFIAAATVLALTVALLSLPDETASRLKQGIKALFLPVFGLASSVPRLAQRAGDAVTPRGVLQDELARLGEENQRLQIETLELRALRDENARLRAQLSWRTNVPGQYRLARVIGRDPANWWRSLRIDAGTGEGIPTNAVVLTPAGLVGRVAQVGLGYSEVVLVGDSDCRVAAIAETTREQGVIGPAAGSFDPTTVELRYLPANASLKAGHRILTSGVGGVFPGGIPVGVVAEVGGGDMELNSTARVKLFVNANRLEEVWVRVK